MPIDLESVLKDAVVMAPMTMGSNLPYRRLCDELGATITMGEMAVARNLQRGKRQERVLVKRSPHEHIFGAQLAGREEEELTWAADLAAKNGADLVDLNCGCPIDVMTRKGLGSAILRQPKKLEKLVRAMCIGSGGIPVTVKIRLGWDDNRLVHIEAAQAAVEGGASAITVHGRTRQARYRRPASWEMIGEVVQAVSVPVIGNGDILFPPDIARAKAQSGCGAVMVARGALIKPWIFREAKEGTLDLSGVERLEIYRRYADLAKEHWGNDEHGLKRVTQFLEWHLDFWTRYVPPKADGTLPQMQEREEGFDARDEVEALLKRHDPAAHTHIAKWLIDDGGRPILPAPDPVGPEDSEPRAIIPEG
jgi:tRNA-dihydrouridine synthase 3